MIGQIIHTCNAIINVVEIPIIPPVLAGASNIWYWAGPKRDGVLSVQNRIQIKYDLSSASNSWEVASNKSYNLLC